MEALAGAEARQDAEAIKGKWLYLVLAWVFINKEYFADPLEMVEKIYADFGYPERIVRFIRYMPSAEPDLGSRELNEQRLYGQWKRCLDELSAEYAPRGAGTLGGPREEQRRHRTRVDAMNTFEGARALDEIARRWALHDGRILSITARVADGSGVRLDLVCSPRPESPVAELRILFTGVTRIELRWSEDPEFYFVSGYKALVQPSGMVYLSLDPYDDTAAEVDPRDASVIEARGILAEFVMKSSLLG